MQLGILTTSFKPYEWYSGISNAVYLMAKQLNEKYDVDVKIFAPEAPSFRKHKIYKNFTVSRFKTIDLSKLGGYHVSFEAFKMVLKNNLDIIHSFHYGYFPATIGFNVSKKKNIPHMFTTAYHPPSNRIKKNLLKLYNISQGAHIIRNSSTVLPFNKNEKDQLSLISKGNFKIVPCPINHNIYKPRGSKADKLTVAFVGPMELWKGPVVAYKIFRQLESERKDIKFIFVGNGTLKHQVKLYNSLKTKSSKRFLFTHDLTSKQLADIYNMADVLIAPTVYESFGCTIAEAMMCGTPVVSTRVGAVPETVGKGGFLVNYGDWEKMKKYVDLLLDDEKIRKKLSKNAIKQANNYRYDVVTEKIFRIYKKNI
ncbi:MAG: glycosyltransferase family 4 protein [Candidatus Aenigmatarchaeota archaeon]